MALAHSAVKVCGEDFIFAVVGCRQTAPDLIRGFRRAAARLFFFVGCRQTGHAFLPAAARRAECLAVAGLVKRMVRLPPTQ